MKIEAKPATAGISNGRVAGAQPRDLHRILIVGAGLAGLAMAIRRRRRLRAPRRDDFEINAAAEPVPEVHRGPATLVAGEAEIGVEVHLAGHVEPIDGSYRWQGRITAHPEVTALHAAGNTRVRIRIPGGTESAARLAEIDPWGNTRVTGQGRPPFPLH